MTLGERVLNYRARYNMSQEDFASKARVCLMTVNAIENGRRQPTKLTQTKIEQILKEAEENVVECKN